MQLTCPHCGGEDIIYIEDLPTYWEPTEIDDPKPDTAYFAGYAITDFEAFGTNKRFECRGCWRQWPVGDVAVEFV